MSRWDPQALRHGDTVDVRCAVVHERGRLWAMPLLPGCCMTDDVRHHEKMHLGTCIIVSGVHRFRVGDRVVTPIHAATVAEKREFPKGILGTVKALLDADGVPLSEQDHLSDLVASVLVKPDTRDHASGFDPRALTLAALVEGE